jgi:hypothetical protein
MVHKCTHTKLVAGQWEISFDGEKEWVDGHDLPSTVDIDLHRYKCVQCDEVMFYSEKAKRHFENGESFNINGLE